MAGSATSDINSPLCKSLTDGSRRRRSLERGDVGDRNRRSLSYRGEGDFLCRSLLFLILLNKNNIYIYMV